MQSRPCAFARYSALSALLIQSETVAMPAWDSASPMLTVQRRPRAENGQAATCRRSLRRDDGLFPARVGHHDAELVAAVAPPVSTSRRQAFSRRANSSTTSSPVVWP